MATKEGSTEYSLQQRGGSEVTAFPPLEDLANVQVSNRQNNDVLAFDANLQVWINAQAQGGGGPLGLDDLTDVSLPAQIGTGDLLYYDGVAWTAIDSGVIVGTLFGLTDTNIQSPTTQSVLRWDGVSAWIDGLLNFGELGDVLISSPAANQVPLYVGNQWVNTTLTFDEVLETPNKLYFTDVDKATLDSLSAGGPAEVTSVFGRGLTASGDPDIVAAEGDYNLALLGDVSLNSPVAAQVLRHSGSEWVNAALSLNDLGNVNTGGVQDGEALTWNLAAGQWVPGSGGGGASTLPELDDVDDVMAPNDGDALMFNATTQEWTSSPPPGSGGGEANNGLNLGSGAQVFHSKSGVLLNFRSFLSSQTGVNVVQGGDHIDFTIDNATTFFAGLMSAADKGNFDMLLAADYVNSFNGRNGDVVPLLGDYDSSLVGHAPSGGMVANNVNDAINELNVDKASAVHSHTTAGITDVAAPGATGTILRSAGAGAWLAAFLDTSIVPDTSDRRYVTDSERTILGQLELETPATNGWANVTGTVFGRSGNIVAVASDYDANQVDYDPAGSNLVAVEVQAAIDELDTVKQVVSWRPAMADISNVDETGKADGDVLAWNQSAGQYEPVANAGGGGSVPPELDAYTSDGSPTTDPSATGINSLAMGGQASAGNANAIAAGFNAQVSADDGIAIGRNAMAAGQYAVALGQGSQASGINSIVLGINGSEPNDNSLLLDLAGAVTMPAGTTAERPGTTRDAMMRWNVTTRQWEYYDSVVSGGGWLPFGGGVQMLKLDPLTFDGTQVTFNLLVATQAVTPTDANEIFYNLYGQDLEPGVDFTVAGSQITFSEAPESWAAGHGRFMQGG